MSVSSNLRCNKWHAYFWPIHRHEIKKFLPLFCILACICFNYTILKAAKDTLVITAPRAGAEVIPFIKLYVILPAALLMAYLLTRLFNRHSQERVFYIVVGSFLAFFLLFAFVLYPLRDVIHPTNLADSVQAHLPQGFSGMICVFRYWSYTLFYVIAELWGTAVMSVMFWGFVNEITSVGEAKRYYSILTVGANISTIMSGYITVLLSKQTLDLHRLFGEDRWGQSIGLATFAVVGSGLLMMGVFRWYHRKVIHTDHKLKKIQEERATKRRSIKLGIRKNFAYLIKSKYLICTAIIVFAFHISINMIEIIWKSQIRELYPNPNDFNTYMGKVLITIGWTSALFALFVCNPLIRRWSWTLGALITPIVLLATGIFFFGFVLLKNHPLCTSCAAALGLTPLALGVLLGFIQNVLSRVCKYTVFDTTKEIALIPLNPESKLKGKAAIDGIGSRLGKSGGSLLHSGFLMFFGSISISTPYVALLLLVIVLVWIGTAQSLGRQFNRLVSAHEKLTIRDKETSPSPEKKPLAESI